MTNKIDMQDTVCIRYFAIASESIEDQGESLIAFHVTRTLEEFIEHSADQVLRRGDKPGHACFIGQLTADQTIVVRVIDIDLHIKRSSRRCWSGTWRECGRA
jgi:hypothetical protein